MRFVIFEIPRVIAFKIGSAEINIVVFSLRVRSKRHPLSGLGKFISASANNQRWLVMIMFSTLKIKIKNFDHIVRIFGPKLLLEAKH